MFPVRCFTCGKVIGHKKEQYDQLVQSGVKNDRALNQINMSRYCCRRMFLGHVDLIDQLLLFPDDNVETGKKKNAPERSE